MQTLHISNCRSEDFVGVEAPVKHQHMKFEQQELSHYIPLHSFLAFRDT